MTRRARLAIDIGGTFTDVALDVSGRLATAKTPTTPAAPEEGVLAGVRQVMAASGTRPGDVALVVHGTTLATNALIERKGARTALLATEGHRDALEMAHENRFEQYDIDVDRPPPLVPSRLRLPVRERVDKDGNVLLPLDEASVRSLLPALEQESVESVAVGLLHGYANPAHERRIREIVTAALPGLAVTLASDVCPEVREYERLSTACANAYVQPLMSRCLRGLARSLQEAGLACPLLLMTSSGGLTTLDAALEAPVRLVESGPAGGAVLAAHLADCLELDRVLSFDMGGTTAKLCVVDAGRPQRSRTFEVARSYRFQRGSGLPVRVPVVEMVEIGAGGGSVAGVDDMKRLRVGPDSAGADPGPAAYGRGGTRPTVTDADLVLGRLDPQAFAGGAISLDRERASQAVDRFVGAALGLTTAAAAAGLQEMVDENMANAARAHAAEWGKSMAGRALVAFGGSAPLHAARLADKLGLDRIVVPAAAGVGSAVGFLLAPVSYEVVRSRYMRLSEFDPEVVARVLTEMRDEAHAVVAQGAPEVPVVETARAYMRYAGQGHEIAVELPAGTDGRDGRARLSEAFDQNYETLFGRTIPGLDVEVLSWTLVLAAAPESGPAMPTMPRPPGRSASPGSRGTAVLRDGPAGESVAAAVHRREGLPPGSRVAGPALIAEEHTTTVVPAGFDADVLPGRELLVRRRSPGADEPAPDRADPSRRAGRRPQRPFDQQVMWSRLLSVVEEQARALVRTAFSTAVREAGDLSAGVFDRSGRMLAQAVTGTPGHVNAMAESVGAFLEQFPAERLAEGDVLLTNDPWTGTGHLNDFTVVTPAFHKGRVVAFFAATSHVADVGGRGFGADANQVYEEGIRVPIGYLARGGRLDKTLMRLVRANVRDPDTAEGDLHSLIACNRTGCRRLAAMIAEFELDSLDPLADAIVAASRRTMLERIGELRFGAYRNQMTIDGYDRELVLACTMTVAADGIRIDFDGTSGASRYGINVPLTYTRAYAAFGVRCVVGADVPNNAGSLSTVRVSAPKGSVLNAAFPAAVSARHSVGQMLPDVVLGCLGQAMGGGVPAEGASCLWNPVLLGGHGLTGEHDYGAAQPFVVNPFHTGGTGARPGKDGLSATAFPSGVTSTPVEITETVAPLVFWRKEYLCDSGGPGEFRGGLGQVMEIAHAEGAPFAVSKMFDRTAHPARGRDGGHVGAPGRAEATRGSRRLPLRAKGREVVPPGHRLVLETPGGGGLGDPRKRRPEAVAEDVRNGYVSREAAVRVYGVAGLSDTQSTAYVREP